MSETPNTEENIQEVNGIPRLFMTVSPSQNVQTPVDRTLSISEMAADAKSTGDAINNLGEMLEEEITNLATDVIPKSWIDSTLTVSGNVAEAKTVGDALAGKADIAVESISVNGKTMDDESAIAIDASDIPMSGTDTTTVYEKVTAAGENIEAANARIDTLAENIGSAVRSVNNVTPDETGNVNLIRVPYADNLLSTGSQNSRGTFLIRASGGDASISDGTARISSIYGNIVHDGFVPESINASVDGEFTISIDRATFIGAASGSGTYTFSYTTGWDTDPSGYGITVSGTPENGDSISVAYVQEVRGTITAANPQSFISTGWNLYNTNTGYARVVNYSENYGFRVGGAYSAVSFSETADGVQVLLTVTDRNFRLPADATDGYIFVTGADSTTEIYMTWSDWTMQANGGVHQVYTQNVINLSGIMSGAFPYGLLAVGDVRDEISFANLKAYSWIEQMEYSEDNRAYAVSTGRAYEVDENNIYLVRAGAVEAPLSEGLGQYLVNGHGIEFFTGTDIPPVTYIVYSNDLKNKLERDVLTISQQTLTDTQQEQVQGNLGLNSFINAIGRIKVQSLATTTAITSSYVVYNTYSGRKFSDYQFVLIVARRGKWILGSTMLLRDTFTKTTGSIVMTKWNGSDIEYDVKYESDTSYRAKYISSVTGETFYIEIIGISLNA